MQELWKNLPPQPISTLLLALTLLVTATIYTFRTIHNYARLRHFPGPRGASWSKYWMIHATATGQMPFALADACRRYGSLARIGPNDLVTDDVDVLRTISELRGGFVRGDWYNATAFSHQVNHAFCERDDGRHAERRNKLIPGYSGRGIEGLERGMDERIVDFCRLIERKYLSDGEVYRPVDLARICSFFTLDVIYTLAFGEAMGFLECDDDVYGYLENQKAMLPVFEWLSTLPGLEGFLRTPWISKRVMPKTTDKTGIGLLFKFAEKAVAERRAVKRNDMLGSFLEHGLTDQEAVQESVLQIIAGSDTTASTIRMLLFFLATNPRAYQKLTEEIDASVQSGASSSTVIQDSQATQMPYLEACVKEGLRMWPPVVGLMSKTVPPDGATLLDRFVPGGTCIGYCAWGLHRKRATFGADADIFRPERWLPHETNELRLAEMNKTVDLVFGYGKNACLGKPIAQMEIRKTVVEMLRRFEISVVRPEKPFNSVNRNGLFIQDDMFVRFEKRSE